MCALHYFQITAFVIELKHYLQHAKLLRKNKTNARKSVVGVVLNIQAVNFFPSRRRFRSGNYFTEPTFAVEIKI